MTIERILANVYTVAITTRVGQRLGPRIAGGELEIAFALRGVKLHTVIAGVGVGETIKDLSESFKRTQCIGIYVRAAIRRQVRRQGFERNLVEVRLANQVATEVADVVCLDKETTRQLALHTNTKVLGIRDVEVRIDRVDRTNQRCVSGSSTTGI